MLLIPNFNLTEKIGKAVIKYGTKGLKRQSFTKYLRLTLLFM